MVTSFSPDAQFTYHREFKINVLTEPNTAYTYYHYNLIEFNSPQWYEDGSTLKLQAPPEIPNSSDIKYTFKNWSLPQYGGSNNSTLKWSVNRPGIISANYDVNYWLKSSDKYADIEGDGWEGASWHKNGERVNWWLKCPTPRLSSGIPHIFNVLVVPSPTEGWVTMDKPQTIPITWSEDWPPVIWGYFATLILGVIAGIVATIIYYKCKHRKRE